MRSLSRLLADGRPPDRPVAFGRGRDHDWAEFSRRVGSLAERIRAEGSRGRWLVDIGDAYAFGVAIFGLARAGAEAVIPPNRQAGTLRELVSGCHGTLADVESAVESGAGGHVLVIDPDDATASSGRLPEPVELDPDAPLLTLFTSGTTGEAKEVPKTLRHLDEVVVLEEAFGASLPQECRIFSSAPPQHLYGLLFRVLWPLASGRSFHSETYLHPEELLGQLARVETSALAATPSQLRRFAGRTGLVALKGRLLRVFSSGGPLDPDTAASLAADLGEPPIEIFGSTETGGIASRQQGHAGSATLWRPMPRVVLARDEDAGQLVVSSPFVSVGTARKGSAEQVYRLGDRVSLFEDSSFQLEGRADRVVKVGEKRLSLPDMESRLREHPWVSEASLLLIDQASEPRVAAVVVTTREGAEALAREGRRATSRALSAHLAPWWDRVLLPRAWRYAAELPRDTRGKTPIAVLRRLFDASGEARPNGPVVLEERIQTGRLERSCVVPSDLAQLEGHFVDFPIVAGVVQLGWAIEAARDLLGSPPAISAVEALKFREILRPGDHFTLVVEVSDPGDRVRFELADDERVFSSGRCLVGRSA